MQRRFNLSLSIAFLVVASFVAGCGGGVGIPPRMEVVDVSSGRKYTTYKPWGKVEKGIGYAFTDIETGGKVTLTNYELRPLEGQKTVPSGSADAKAFKTAKERADLK